MAPSGLTYKQIYESPAAVIERSARNDVIDDAIEAVYDVRPRNRAERRLYQHRPNSDACRRLRNRTGLRQSLGSYLD